MGATLGGIKGRKEAAQGPTGWEREGPLQEGED